MQQALSVEKKEVLFQNLPQEVKVKLEEVERLVAVNSVK